mmetsp:Transcript_33042/g.51509  ORF Transcript_33042/g.51509 Transcript_33042/m.51509 type:complete len:359 (+) Transcript_33042:1-1077(+)
MSCNERYPFLCELPGGENRIAVLDETGSLTFQDSCSGILSCIKNEQGEARSHGACMLGWHKDSEADSASHGVVAYYGKDRTWQDAERFCIEEGGHLASVKNQKELLAIMSVKCSKSLWIGANDRSHEGRWVWEGTGEEVNMDAYWQYEEPNSYEGMNEDCAFLGLWEAWDQDFYDVGCDAEAPFACFIPGMGRNKAMKWDGGAFWETEVGDSCYHDETYWIIWPILLGVSAGLGITGACLGFIICRFCQHRQDQEDRNGIPMQTYPGQPHNGNQWMIPTAVPVASTPNVQPEVVQGELIPPAAAHRPPPELQPQSTQVYPNRMFNCPLCQNPFQDPDDGQAVSCPTCHNRVQKPPPGS